MANFTHRFHSSQPHLEIEPKTLMLRGASDTNLATISPFLTETQTCSGSHLILYKIIFPDVPKQSEGRFIRENHFSAKSL